jgi:hypothetical protein
MNGKPPDRKWGEWTLPGIAALAIGLVGGFGGSWMTLKMVEDPPGPPGPCKILGGGKYAVCCMQEANCNVDEDPIMKVVEMIIPVRDDCDALCMRLSFFNSNCYGSQSDAACTVYSDTCSGQGVKTAGECTGQAGQIAPYDPTNPSSLSNP